MRMKYDITSADLLKVKEEIISQIKAGTFKMDVYLCYYYDGDLTKEDFKYSSISRLMNILEMIHIIPNESFKGEYQSTSFMPDVRLRLAKYLEKSYHNLHILSQRDVLDRDHNSYLFNVATWKEFSKRTYDYLCSLYCYEFENKNFDFLSDEIKIKCIEWVIEDYIQTYLK